jgi:predicted transcriptional regulator
MDKTTKQKMSASFIEEALASWAEYQATGQHLTGEEVRKWLSTWGTGAEAEVPACHS